MDWTLFADLRCLIGHRASSGRGCRGRRRQRVDVWDDEARGDSGTVRGGNRDRYNTSRAKSLSVSGSIRNFGGEIA